MMEVVSGYLEAFAWVAAYSTIGSVVGLVVWKVFEPRYEFTHGPGPILSLLFWPIALPILFPFLIFKAMMVLPDLRLPSIKLPKLPSRKKKNNTESPTKILGHLVAMRVAQEPYNIKSSAFISQDDRIGVTYARSSGFIIRITDIIINGDRVSLLTDELIPILEACQAADAANKKRRETQNESDRQHKALDAIESVLLTPIKN